MASHARKLLQRILHLKEPFTRSSRTSRRERFDCSVQQAPGPSPPKESATESCHQQCRACSGMAAGWCESICTHSEAKTIGHQPKEVSRSAAKKPFLSKKVEDWCKIISLINLPSDCLGHLENSIKRRKGERYHESCDVPTVKHPETIHVWGCFSTKRVGSLIILPKNTARNKEWYQNVLQE
uniref:Uncharacterized protein n=1 Tax=Cyprinus carpio carpio TaxID=630221 RepID=A0A9J7Y3D4_CYPCA